MRRQLVSKSVIRYLIAGGFSYFIEISVLLWFNKILNFSAELSTALAFWVGFLVTFTLQKLFAFKDYKKTVKGISRQLFLFSALVLINYVLAISLVAIFPEELVVVSRTLALFITTIWNFFFYRKIFGDKRFKSDRKLIVASKRLEKGVVFCVLVSLPILIFFWQYLFTGNSLIVGDLDYYAQIYEAFRISVVKYHQLPLWNPWLSGGMPLFANPQFGLISIQSLFVIVFGTVFGLKLAYITYSLLGFWGMYLLGRNVLSATKLRSVLVGYIWVFSGFFAGHNISHFTFSLFFLLPWLLYFLALRKRKWSWFWFGLVVSVIALSSLHYALLMVGLIILIYAVLLFFEISIDSKAIKLNWQIGYDDLAFFIKAALTILLLAGYRLITTYMFVSHNQRITDNLLEVNNSPDLIFKSLFLPVGTFVKYPTTQWGWGEYSMYIGFATFLALVLCAVFIVSNFKRLSHVAKLKINGLVFVAILIGLLTLILAIGDFGSYSPYHLLHKLPGFEQTRVSSRWLIFTVFSILVFLLSWPHQKRTLNLLLAISVLELFLTFGPPRVMGTNTTQLPRLPFNNSFSQYDNGNKHLDFDKSHLHSYYFTTSQNIGQIYGDDSLINTLNKVLGTGRCGININPVCDLVLSDNAKVTYWSPNKIILKRTAPGSIELNMNVESGWQVNGVYPFAIHKNLDPARKFTVSQPDKIIVLEYEPKLSPSWLMWRLTHFYH